MLSKFVRAVSSLHSFSRLNVPLYGKATFCLSTRQLMALWLVSTFDSTE